MADMNDSSDTSFLGMTRRFPWTAYIQAVDTGNASQIQHYSTQLQSNLVPFVVKPPTVPVDDSCKPQLIHPPVNHKNCILKPKPRNVGILWHFDYDVDTLEIHLHELDAVVHKFFIMEAIRSDTNFLVKKPLIWDRLKFSPRFQNFTEKIVHFVLDDANLSRNTMDHKRNQKYLLERLGWEKFFEWNKNAQTGSLQDVDLLGFLDVDQVPTRDNVAFLKYCELPSDPISIGIWLPSEDLNFVSLTDFSLKNSNQFGDPTFWTLATAMENWNNFRVHPHRQFAKSSSFLLGGIHLSNYAYPPYQMIKWLSASEEKQWRNHKRVIAAGVWFAVEGNFEKGNAILNPMASNAKRRFLSLEESKGENQTGAVVQVKKVVEMPWFLECNGNRYPGYSKLYDHRLG